jgi:hypothetical protein
MWKPMEQIKRKKSHDSSLTLLRQAQVFKWPDVEDLISSNLQHQAI